MLADLGAEVIKIEERDKGDPGRAIYAVAGGMAEKSGRNFYFEANNRHKKSLALDLKNPRGREIAHKLAAKSDVFVQNFRKGVAARLGLDYETLRALNERLIYASSSGYGPEGPDSAEPSFDYLGQARSGIMNVIGPPGSAPSYIFGGIADQMGAIMLAYGIMTALLARERYGVGQEVDASHLGSMIALQGLNVSFKTIVGMEFGRYPREQAYNPLWNHYKCADGQWLAFAMLQADRYWKDFCNTVGIGELAEDPRFIDIRVRGQNAAALVEILDRTFASRPRDEWLKILRDGGDFVYTIVNSISDLPHDPQVLTNKYIVDYEHPAFGSTQLVGLPVILSKTPGDPRGYAPELGQHNESILTEMLGYSWDDIADLQRAGVL